MFWLHTASLLCLKKTSSMPLKRRDLHHMTTLWDKRKNLACMNEICQKFSYDILLCDFKELLAISDIVTYLSNPSHPSTSRHSLHTVPLHFLRCWWGEFVKQSRAFIVSGQFLYSNDKCLTQGWYCMEKLDTNHSSESKG